MKNIVILFLVLFTTSNADEVSVLGAGDLNSNTPYGLTKTEKYILQNRNKVTSVESKTDKNTQTIESLDERVEGLETIVEGLTQKSHKNRVSFNSWLDTYTIDKKNIDASVLQLQKEQESANLAMQNDLNTMKNVITELSTLIDTINKSYVTKDEYNKLVTDVNSFKEVVLKELKKVNKPAVDPLTKMSNFAIEKEAHRLYTKKRYTKAIEYYEYLIQKKYKPARAHYMIGEMYYYRKNYKKALSYFKESAARYSKASYMPTLLLHTAVSMKKLGDNRNAEKFFEVLVVKYPKSREANYAKKELAK